MDSKNELTIVTDVWQNYWRKAEKFGLDSYMRYFWKEHLAYIVPVLRSLPGNSTVIDVGVGTGSLLKMIHEMSRLEVVGLDISRNAIRESKIRFSRLKSKSSFVLGDVFHLPFREGVFDVVVCLGLIEHFNDSVTPMSNVLKLVKNRGCAFVSVPQAGSLYRPYKLWQIRRKIWPFGFEKEFTADELKGICKKLSMYPTRVVGVDYYPSFLKIVPFEIPFRPFIVRITEFLEKRVRDPIRHAHMLMLIVQKKCHAVF